MTANHELTLHERLDAMVKILREPMGSAKIPNDLGVSKQELDATVAAALSEMARADAAEAQVKALMAERDVLRDAALKAERWLWDPDENQLERFERIGDEFYADTLHLRPGKDCRTEDTSSPENTKRFQDWCRNRNREVLASLRAALMEDRDAE